MMLLPWPVIGAETPSNPEEKKTKAQRLSSSTEAVRAEDRTIWHLVSFFPTGPKQAL